MKTPNLTRFSESKKDELILKLKEICDCPHFIYGTFADLKDDADVDTVLEYLKSNSELQSSDVIVFTLVLRKERE